MATVRIAEEGMRHRVNHRTGKWRGSVIYPQNKHPIPFRGGQELVITASAPGHLPRTVNYRLAERRNAVRIPVESLGSPLGMDVAGHRSGSECSGEATVLSSASSRIALDPETLGRLADLEDADPELTAAFSEFLLSQGAEHLESGLSWARIAREEAHVRSGSAYVGLVNDLFRVRAVGHHLRWLQREHRFIEEPTNENKAVADALRLEAADIAAEWVAWAGAAQQPLQLPQALCLASAERSRSCVP